MSDEVLRRQLMAQLDGGQAYTPVAETICAFPKELVGRKLLGVTHTAWEIVEHMRIAQWDILRFTVDSSHVSPPWPDGYWPKRETPRDPEEWHRTIETFLRELAEVKRLAEDPNVDLFQVIPHGTGQTILREILLVADHNAYHLGQVMVIRRALEALPS